MAQFGSGYGLLALTGVGAVAAGGVLFALYSPPARDGEIRVLPALTAPDSVAVDAGSAPATPPDAASAPASQETAGVAPDGAEGTADTAAAPAPSPEAEASAEPPNSAQDQAATGVAQAPAPREDTPPDGAAPAQDTRAATQAPGADRQETVAAPADEPADAQPEPEVPGPRFDLVRVEADGQVLVAGTSAPSHEIRLRVDGADAASGAADAEGGFVLFLSLGVSEAPRVLDLVSIAADGSEYAAAESVILAPPPLPTPSSETLAAEKLAAAELAAETDQAEPQDAVLADAEVAIAAQDDVAAALSPDGAADLDAVSANKARLATGDATPAPAAVAATEDASVVSVAQPETGGVRVASVPDQPSPRAPDAAALAVAARPAAPALSQGGAPPSSRVLEGPSAAGEAVAAVPAVLVARDTGVSLLQPSDLGSARLDRVVVDVISYDAEGSVVLEGRSAAPPPPIDRVRIYLNNAPIDTAPIREDGSWRAPLAEVATGIYTLRVDQLDTSGNVVSRFETPFKREDPSTLARLEAERAQEGAAAVDISVITVQPGYTLWGIASDRYGDGFQYVAIFDANAGQIRDPDLIFPGQVFDLPEIDAPASATR
ncbi:MAG: LysM peptidoglycan-binding domain-containing protein [Pseudomonadota bacterium]